MNADRSYRIILADDHALFLSGLQGLLSRRAECEVVGTAANGEECLALMQESEHDVVLMDIDMPVLDGIRATERALALNPEEKIITLSMHGDDEFYFRMVEAGAKGFILKSADIDEVATAVPIFPKSCCATSWEASSPPGANVRATCFRTGRKRYCC